jgi:hypothetical protein
MGMIVPPSRGFVILSTLILIRRPVFVEFFISLLITELSLYIKEDISPISNAYAGIMTVKDKFNAKIIFFIISYPKKKERSLAP